MFNSPLALTRSRQTPKSSWTQLQQRTRVKNGCYT